jgi:hypothetical protein
LICLLSQFPLPLLLLLKQTLFDTSSGDIQRLPTFNRDLSFAKPVTCYTHGIYRRTEGCKIWVISYHCSTKETLAAYGTRLCVLKPHHQTLSIIDVTTGVQTDEIMWNIIDGLFPVVLRSRC